MKNYILFNILIILFHNVSTAQIEVHSVINSAGGTFEKGHNTYEWSVGEMTLINQMESSKGKYIITNGFLQPVNNIYGRPGNRAVIFNENEIHILPNPTKQDLSVHFSPGNAGKLKLVMFNDQGIVVYKNDLTLSGHHSYHTVRMKHLSDGTYMLSIELISADLMMSPKKRVYKIIKIQ